MGESWPLGHTGRPTTGEGQVIVKGRTVFNLLHHFERVHGAEWYSAFKARIEEECGFRIDERAIRTGNVPFWLQNMVMAEGLGIGTEGLSEEDRARVVEIGRLVARMEVGPIIQLFGKVLPVSTLVDKLAKRWSSTHSEGRLRVEILDMEALTAVLRLEDFDEINEMFTVYFTSYLEEAGRMLISKDMKVRCTRNVIDEYPFTEFTFEW